MADLADLGIRIHSEEVAVADDRLDDFTASAMRAETATESLGAASRSSGAALASMNTAVRQQDMVLRATRNSTGLASHEMLNFSRQLADVGMMAALGQAPLILLLQQGPQIADVFQSAAMRGVTFSAALKSIWLAAAPILAVMAPIAAVAGAVAGGFALLNRELSKGYPKDITDGLGLTEEQLKRVEIKTVTFGDTVMATFTVVGRHIMDGPIGKGLDWLGDKFTQVMDWVSRTVFESAANISGALVGGYRTIREQWENLPAAFGDIMITAANNVIRTVADMLNRSRGMINAFIIAANTTTPGFDIPLLGEVEAPQLENRFAGAGLRVGASFAANFMEAQQEARAGMRAFGDEIEAEALRRARARALEEAGDPNKGRRGGKSEAERLTEEMERYIQSLRDQAATTGMSAIAAKEYEIQQKALRAATVGLNDEVEEAGRLLLEKMRAEAANTRAMDDQLEVVRLETRLIGAGNVERAVAIAQLVEMQRLREAGVDPTSDVGRTAIDRAGQLAGAQEELRIGQDRYNDSLRLSVDLARQADEATRDMARGLAEAFGDAGSALGDLMTGMSDYRTRMAEIAEAEADMRRQGILSAERQAMFERDRASATVGAYGDMLSAARGFFREGSDGYRIMMAIEQAYRLQQLAGMIQEMVLGRQATAQSVADSMAKGAASTAAGAAKMFESLGPLAFPAVAAMLAVLASLGLKGGSSGGAGPRLPSAANDNTSAEASTAAVRAFSARDAQSRDASAAAIAARVDVRVSADRDGLNAYVEGKAAEVATPIAANAALTGYAVQREERRQAVRRARQSFVR